MKNTKIPIIQASEIKGIIVELADKNKSWKAGEYLFKEDLHVYLTYDSGEKRLLDPNEVVLEQEQILLNPGINVINVKYMEFISYVVVSAKERKPIGLVGNLKENKKYFINQEIGVEEMEIFLLYNNGDKTEVTADCIIEGSNCVQLGTNLIKINYYMGTVCYSTSLVVEGVEKYEDLLPQVTSGATIYPEEENMPKPTLYTEINKGGDAVNKVITYSAIGDKEQPISTIIPIEHQENNSKNCSYTLISSIKGIVWKNKGEKQKIIYTKKNVNLTVKTSYAKSLQYQLIKKGKKKTNNWKNYNKKIRIKKQGKWTLYVRIIGKDGKQYIEKTNLFIIDKTKPIVRGVKSGKTYKKTIRISYKDEISGIKSATLNGENIKQSVKIKKNGNYRMVIVDKAKNKRVVRFKIAIPKKKPTVTPIPTINPTEKPQEEVPVTHIYCTKTMYLKEGEQGILNYQVIPENATNSKVTFKSSNKSVATVNSNGQITAKESGIAYVVVRAKEEDSIYATCVVYVTKE